MTSNFLTGAQWYAENMGWKILPTHGINPLTGLCTCNKTHADPRDMGKHPAIGEWQNAATNDPIVIGGWWHRNPQFNVGVMSRASGFFVLDIDPRNGGIESYARLEEILDGEIPDTLTAITGSYNTAKYGQVRGRHMFYKVPETENLKGNLKSDGLDGLDIKHNGYAMLAPSYHLSGVQYEWAPGHAPWEMAMAEPSQKMLDFFRKRGGSSGAASGGTWDFFSELEWGGRTVDLDGLLEEGIDEGSRSTTVFSMACAVANRYPRLDQMDRVNIETMFLRYNHEKIRPPMEQDELLRQVRNAIEFVAKNPKGELSRESAGLAKDVYLKNIGSPQPTIVTASTREADEDSSLAIPLVNVTMSKDSDAIAEEDGGDDEHRSLTDTGNGRRLVDKFGNVIRYSPGLGWFNWTDTYWKPDTEDLGVRELAKRLAPIIGAEAASAEDADAEKAHYMWAKSTKSNARQTAAIESAQSDPRVVVPVEYWDNNPYLLGVANGVVDLRTGDLLQGRPDLHITRRSPVAYGKSFTNTRFQNFLDYATNGDKELQEWIQKAFGYTLTGLRTYDVMFLVYGPPGSGKNVLVESLVKALGAKQYAFPLDSQILAQGDGKMRSSDEYHWAELRGRRMIWVDELPEADRLKENSVKKLTGSTEISARSPGEKPFTFESQGKLWITTNHRPVITDDAMWRRIRPIPWMNTPPTPDPTLKAYLHDPEGGLPAVLAWAVEGAIKLLASEDQDALGWCGAVADAAEMYKKNEDRMGLFLDEETFEEVSTSVPVKGLYMRYQAWSDSRGERPLSQIRFTNKIADRGLQVVGNGSRAHVLGRGLIMENLDGNTGTVSGGTNYADLLFRADNI